MTAPASPQQALAQKVEAYIKDPKNHHDHRGMVAWEDILKAHAPASEADVEDAINHLMDDGRVYEPILGWLKTT